MGKTSAATRQRRKTNATRSEKRTSNESMPKLPDKKDSSGASSILDWNRLYSHSAVWVLILIAIPFLLNLGWRKMILQTNMSSRPPVGRRDERQVLILGSMMSFGGHSKSSRNSYENNMATNLRRDFGLEIGYEDSDSSWNFVRDGTASWIHGLRYFERQGGNPNNKKGVKSHEMGGESAFQQRIRYLCRLKFALTYDSRDRYGFEQSVFGDDSEFNDCSAFNPDSRRCQLPVCEETLKKEYGCALRSYGEEDEQSCDMMPFRTTLLQTRQPWHIVRSLVERYCWKKNSVQENMPSSLEDLLTALELIPPFDPSNDKTIDSSEMDKNSSNAIPTVDHCVNQFIDYVAEYYNTVLDKSTNMAVASGSNIVKTYKIEETSPCEVAELSGLFDAETTVYPPNHEKVKRKCAIVVDSSTSSSTTANLLFEDDEDMEVISVKRDLVPHATPEHLKRIRKLFLRLGYEYSEE